MRPSRRVRKLAKAYNVRDTRELDYLIEKFVNLLELTHKDGYTDKEAWIYFIESAVKDLFR